jgi:phenylacetate-CoA ligase
MVADVVIHPLDTLSLAERQCLADERLKTLLLHAYHQAPLHRGRFLSEPTGGLCDLETLPLLHKAEWMPHSPPYGERALSAPLASGYVFRTGGTTGEPNFSLFSHTEFQTAIAAFKRVYLAAGLAPLDRVANLFASGNLYASFLFVNRLLEELDCLIFPFSQTSDPELVAWHIKQFNLNVLLGFPTWLLTIADTLAKQKIPVQKVFYAGEHLYVAERAHLKALLNADTIHSAGYAAVDAGLIGYQCPFTEGGHHHVLTGHCHLEIINPETLATCGPGETGLLVVTNLERFWQPVIRYVVGDLGRWQAEDCPCGRSSPVFELLGRGTDSLRIGYAVVSHAEITAALQDLPDRHAHLQLVKSRADMVDQLTLRIELSEKPAPDHCHARTAQIRHAIETAKPDLKRLIDHGYVAPLLIECVEPGALPRHPTTGKLLRTLDHTLGTI